MPNCRRHTNEVNGAYVSTWLHLELINYLDTLKKRAIYCDADSGIHVQKCGQPPDKTCGDKVSDMTNELGLDKYIQEFMSGGPKNYAYRTVNARSLKKKTAKFEESR